MSPHVRLWVDWSVGLSDCQNFTTHAPIGALVFIGYLCILNVSDRTSHNTVQCPCYSCDGLRDERIYGRWICYRAASHLKICIVPSSSSWGWWWWRRWWWRLRWWWRRWWRYFNPRQYQHLIRLVVILQVISYRVFDKNKHEYQWIHTALVQVCTCSYFLFADIILNAISKSVTSITIFV